MRYVMMQVSVPIAAMPRITGVIALRLIHLAIRSSVSPVAGRPVECVFLRITILAAGIVSPVAAQRADSVF